VVIAGGGHVGEGLAKKLMERFQVKLIERNPDKAAKISEKLGSGVVLCGDATDREILRNENIDSQDVFIAVTNSDAVNILSAMLAKRMAVRKSMALINRHEFADLVRDDDIDVAISPRQTTVGSLLTHIRRGDVSAVYSLRKGAAEALEIIVHGDEASSRVVGKAIGNISLPQGTTIGAIVRGDTVLMAHDNIVIQADDHVILFIVEKEVIGEVERLFEPAPTFI
jgi:trk system potassium uptake protein TrkA